MADVYFKCACGKSLAIDEEGVGLTVLCVDCGEPVKVPDYDIEFDCEQCQATHLAPVAVGGDQIKCARCGHNMIVPRPGIDCKPVGAVGTGRDAPIEYGRSGFQLRRAGAGRPAPEPAGTEWRKPFRLIFRLALLVLALTVGAELAQWFISERRTETHGQKSPSVLIKEKCRGIIVQGAKDKSSLQPAVRNQQADQSAELTDETEGGTLVFTAATRFVGMPRATTKVAAGKPGQKSNVKQAAAKSGATARNRQVSDAPAKTSAKKSAIKIVIHPAKALLDECKEAKALLRQNRKDKKNITLTQKIRQCRQDALAYTRTHMGKDLDTRYWKNAMTGILWLSSYREWNTFEEADRAIREALEILADAEPEKEGLNIKTMFDVILLHEQVWCKQAPEACAQWLDEACALAFDEGGNAAMKTRWNFSAPNREIDLISAASILPPERRKAFQDKRERNLLGYLRDEAIPFEWRTKDLRWWAANLKTTGETEKAAGLLNIWQKKYDRKIETPEFFEMRMMVALHGEGDWEKAREMVGRMRELVHQGVVPADNRIWKNMTSKYYKYILMPEYEIKRQYRIEKNNERKKV